MNKPIDTGKNDGIMAFAQAYAVRHRETLESLVPQNAPNYRVDILLDQLRSVFKNTPKLLTCSQDSISRAIKNCCLLGLYPGYGGPAEIYLIPFLTECTLTIGYKGLETTIMRTGRFSQILAKAHWDGDELSFKEEGAKQIFKYEDGLKRETMLGVWCKMVETNEAGTIHFAYMDVAQIQELEKTTRKGGSMTPAWQNWFDRMARKTVIRRACNEMANKDEGITDFQTIIDVEADEARVIDTMTSPKALAEGMK